MRKPFIVRHCGKGRYKAVLVPDHPDASAQGYMLEHRLVMEQKIGRRLRKGEVVHHVNGNGMDNRPDNLELFASPGKHTAARHPETLRRSR